MSAFFYSSVYSIEVTSDLNLDSNLDLEMLVTHKLMQVLSSLDVSNVSFLYDV